MLKGYPAKFIYEPWTAPEHVQRAARCIIGKDYPIPMVNHAEASRINMERMMQVYQSLSPNTGEDSFCLYLSVRAITFSFFSQYLGIGTHYASYLQVYFTYLKYILTIIRFIFSAIPFARMGKHTFQAVVTKSGKCAVLYIYNSQTLK